MKWQEKVLSKLQDMDHYLSELDTLLPSTEEEYSESLGTRRACEKTVELAIESVIDIISIIVSENKLGIPQSEDNLIDIVVRKSIISLPLAKRIKQMKGFRNILIHKYGEVDNHLAYEFLNKEIEDFSEFQKETKKFLKEN